jgi:hypothetical protein
VYFCLKNSQLFFNFFDTFHRPHKIVNFNFMVRIGENILNQPLGVGGGFSSGKGCVRLNIFALFLLVCLWYDNTNLWMTSLVRESQRIIG